MANYAKPLPLRARTVLLAVEGFSNVQIGNFIGFSDPTVRRWRRRYEEHGVEGLEDVQRPGKPPRIDELALVAGTLANDGKPPAEWGVSRWSASTCSPPENAVVVSIEEKTQIQALSRTGKDQPLEVLSGKLSANAF